MVIPFLPIMNLISLQKSMDTIQNKNYSPVVLKVYENLQNLGQFAQDNMKISDMSKYITKNPLTLQNPFTQLGLELGKAVGSPIGETIKEEVKEGATAGLKESYSDLKTFGLIAAGLLGAYLIAK
jgi:hypothetical protein